MNNSTRTILVDWLIEISEEFKVPTETLYLFVSYIDRSLSDALVVRSKLQLVGTTAMLIASKYEEVYPTSAGEFPSITDDTYTITEVLLMERKMLKTLAFNLCTPTTCVCLDIYAALNNSTDHVKCLALYLCELSLLEIDSYLNFYPSIISAASLALAYYICKYPIWSSELGGTTIYHLEDMKDVFLCLSQANGEKSSHHVIQNKYKPAKFQSVSTFDHTNYT